MQLFTDKKNESIYNAFPRPQLSHLNMITFIPLSLQSKPHVQTH